MLTLFKPWRNPEDLKAFTGQSWTDESTAFEFPTIYSQTMERFNLAYECLDARDDFSATRKKNKSNGWFPSTELHTDINDVFAGDGIVTSNDDDDEYLPPEDPDTNPLVREIDDVLSAIGWSVDSDIPETSPDVVMDNLFDMPDVTIKWKEVVQSRRQEILAARQTQRSSFISSRHVPFRQGPENMPESGPLLLLPPSYFMEDYVPPHVSDKDILTQTIRDFKLNTEQRRAFTIVANHSTAIAPKQLLMYLGDARDTDL
ncbi:hypothetical protein AGABI1DRAFT_129995 [Agaricus bisporus var. burnettii JB137-S8]|uniref:Uncharacterized protein n=1 Tax=Agaricus bisporus var. burnettii (strain JB137-S8 / ATCC MYA-4627 / FGSC 10392) TaxID=597362 RepID=K5WQT5_AGABU|nr:uncharacterized protein AGABI1DRAFT_129995 [Agaricus bisporus var. burnettii JB137-S8]EKM77711.1 hypothetical protein AGABI1DRAFT_129995 [Agaricus bisporus var. burnettii JB137-S8]